MKFRAGWFVAAALAALALPASAATEVTPTVLTHHGYLTDESGAAVTRTLSFSFGLFAAQDGGTALWSEDLPAVEVQQGFYAVTLGLAKPLEDVFAAHAEAWLEIAVDGQKLTPRQRAGSVPYAFVARDVLGAIHPASVSIGQTKVIDETGKWVGPQAGPGVKSVTAASPLTGGMITDSGTIGIPPADAATDGYLRKEDWAAFGAKQSRIGNTCVPGSYAIGVQADGTLMCVPGGSGMGSVTEVRTGTGLAGGPITSSGTLSVDRTVVDGWYVDAAGDTMSGPLAIMPAGGLTVGATQLVCAADGSVGVGTATPAAKLDVAGDIGWGGSSRLTTAQGGSIDLGNSSLVGAAPAIRFHYGKGASEEYNTKLVNEADGTLGVYAATLSIHGQIRTAAGDLVYKCPDYSEGTNCATGCVGQYSAQPTCRYVNFTSACGTWANTKPCDLVGR